MYYIKNELYASTGMQDAYYDANGKIFLDNVEIGMKNSCTFLGITMLVESCVVYLVKGGNRY